ncbi:MarR family winged helix-turn-helix transcriptional regulator [Comamonas sp. NoAH]|uniref:MarR family winged helix-turn-helix transcriptional regulator n=1 Tax=Comamonas halotolerans TaxID=3041496 RepID=UPI0024E13DF3|nr:MarR family transcriptional regulator [Comamonas sp. NoAH]
MYSRDHQEWVPLDRTYTHRLHTLMKLADRITQTAYEQESGIPAHEARCLAAIGNFAPLSVKDLARSANLDKAQASRAAQALVEKALILKVSSPTDGRGVLLNLTAEGQKVWERTMRLVTRRNQEITSCLNAKEAQQLDTILDKLVAHARMSNSASEG